MNFYVHSKQRQKTHIYEKMTEEIQQSIMPTMLYKRFLRHKRFQ
jgi:hypothetical protein